jgi:hypothetical protein
MAFLRRCSQWPKDFNFIILETLRPDSEVCSECMALNDRVYRFVCSEAEWYARSIVTYEINRENPSASLLRLFG